MTRTTRSPRTTPRATTHATRATMYVAKAVRWKGGWELHVDGVGVTQVRTLDRAAQQVRDLVETMSGVDADGAEVQVVFADSPGLDERIRDAREATERAAAAQVAAAEQTRRLVGELVTSGFSTTDAAAALGVSRGRVSQLARK